MARRVVLAIAVCDRCEMDATRPPVRPVAIDLFAGAGGLSLGVEMAGFDVVSAVEYDPVHAATHLFNFPRTDVLCRDVARIGRTELLASARRGWKAHNPGAGEWDGVVDVIVGGPSCQGFSSMGKRSLEDDRNKLIGEFVRLVEEVRPRAFVMENVPGILHSQYEPILSDALRRLRAVGYAIADHRTPLDATAFGIPQRRKRVVVMGVLGKTPPELPKPSHETPVTVGEAFEGLPSLAGRTGEDGELFELSPEQSEAYITATNDYLTALRSGASYLSHARHVDDRVLTGFRATEHKPSSIARFNVVEQGKTEPTSRAWRLSSTGPSRTLRAGTGRERGAFSAARPIHPIEPRVITVREAARLHSFPDWFRFHTTNWHGHRQIGNAVPPLLARAVAVQIAAALGLRRDERTPGVVAPSEDALLEMSPSMAAAWLRADSAEVPKTRVRQAAPVSEEQLQVS